MVEEEELSRRLGAAHERLLSGSDGAADEIAQLLLPAMARILLFRFPQVDPGMANEAAVDAILNYLRLPEAFDRWRARLETYVTVFAANRLRDLLRREVRRRRAESEFTQAAWRASQGRATMDAGRSDADAIAGRVCRSRLERTFLSWWFEGRCSCELVGLLGAIDQPRQSQLKHLNRMKGRLTNRIRCMRAFYGS